MLLYTDLESRIMQLIESASIKSTLGSLQTNKIVLGSVSGPSGGSDGPIVPFVGQLSQRSVAYDTDEYATTEIPSGASLLDNLNRIREGGVIIPSYVPSNYTVTTSGNLNEHLEGIDDAIPMGSGGWPFDTVLTVDPTSADADYDTISDALAAATSGTLVLIAPGTWNEAFTVPAGVTLAGWSLRNSETCKLTRLIHLDAGATLANVYLYNATGDSLEINPCGSGTKHTYIYNCSIITDIPHTAVKGTGVAGGSHFIHVVNSYLQGGTAIEFTTTFIAAHWVIYGGLLYGELDFSASTQDELGFINMPMWGGPGSSDSIIDAGNAIGLYGTFTDHLGKLAFLPTYTTQVDDIIDTLADDSESLATAHAIVDYVAAHSGAWPFTNVLTVDATDPDADYATITLALAGASAGDIVLVGPGLWSESVTVPIDVALVGWSQDARYQAYTTPAPDYTNTVIYGKVTLAAGASLANISIEREDGGEALEIGSAADATRRTYIYNCNLHVIDVGPAIKGPAGGTAHQYVYIKDCRITGPAVIEFLCSSASHKVYWVVESGELTGGLDFSGADSDDSLRFIGLPYWYGTFTDKANSDSLYGIYTNSSGSIASLFGLLTVEDNLVVLGTTTLGTVSAGTADYDKFLVLDGSSYVKYRTGEETLDDIGMILDGVDKTVGGGGDYATIADAIAFYQGKTIQGDCDITVAAGTYNETLNVVGLNSIALNGLTITGDGRSLAGQSYIHGGHTDYDSTHTVTFTLSTTSVANDTLTITVAGGGSNPDFSGWGSGDTVLTIRSDTDAIAEKTLASASGNSLVATTGFSTAIASNVGSSITLLPNRTINSATSHSLGASNVSIKGFVLKNTGTSTGLSIAAGCLGVRARNCVVYNTSTAPYGIYVSDGATFATGRTPFTIIAGYGSGTGRGVGAINNAVADLDYCKILRVDYIGILSSSESMIRIFAGSIIGTSAAVADIALYANISANIYGNYVEICDFNEGFRAYNMSFAQGLNTIGLVIGTVNTMSNPTSGVDGNYNSQVRVS